MASQNNGVTVTASGVAIAPAAVPVRPRRQVGRWVANVAVVLFLVAVAWSVTTNERFEWPVVWHYVFSKQLADGAMMTIMLTVACMTIGIVGGIVLAIMRESRIKVLRSVCAGFVWFFRGTPVLVQIIFWYNLAVLYPRFQVGLPGMTPWVDLDVNLLITPIAAALLALGLNEAAYMSEIVRAGLLSVDDGQLEAAQSLGMSRLRATRRIVLPQAMRVIIPPTGNETITMLKMTALVSVVAVADLLYAAQVVYAQTFQTIPLLIAASLWYLLLTSVLTTGQGWLERRFSRGTSTIEHNTEGHWLKNVLLGLLPLRRTI